jgi:ubiquinol-cytochrome c reductase cytochrome b subunit
MRWPAPSPAPDIAQRRHVDSRYHPSAAVRRQLNKVFPTHWSFLLGEVALYSFIVLLLTGVYLSLFFDPSMAEVSYDGVYQPLRGVEMSKAYASTLDISFEVRGGLLCAKSITGRHYCSPHRSWCIWPASFSPARSAAPGKPTG